MILAGIALLGVEAGRAIALETLDFQAPGASPELAKELRAASLLVAAERDGTTDPQDVFAAAQSEYARLLGALYGRGYYSPVIHVLVDGREAAGIAPLDSPATIRRVEVTVTPGPVFAFSRAEIAPLAPDTELPAGFAVGKVAESGMIQEAAAAAISGWRSVGHAKAEVGDQNLAVDHAAETLSAQIGMRPGPKLRFGTFAVEGQSRMREDRIRAIAGFPEGEVFDPAKLSKSADRLRRAGVFKSVSLTEAEMPGPNGTLDIGAMLVEELPRRYGFGAEIGSSEGLELSGYWLHRNLFGGAERLRFDGSITNIGSSSSGTDYIFAVTLERPATFTPDTLASVTLGLEHLDEEDQQIDLAVIGMNATQFVSDRLTLGVGVEYRAQEVSDISGDYSYRDLGFPVNGTYDARNDKFNATKGYFLDGEIMPFLGFDETDSGGMVTLDARAYHNLSEGKPLVLAGRMQVGSILGASLIGTPRNLLFYSGGAGTVRGQPYESLGVYVISPDQKTGGTQFMALSGEVRAMVTDTIGVVGFYDAGFVGYGDFLDENEGAWQAGAGLGLRYVTGLGPIRLDIGGPVMGDTGDGIQVYVGIGQAF